MALKITDTSTVELHFNLKLADGSIADSTRANGQPARLSMAEGMGCPGFERQLLGLTAGDKKTFTLPAGEALVLPDPDNYKTLARAQFPEQLSLEVGTIVEFEQPNGATLLATVRELDTDQVTVDFNHPLSGHDLTFEIEILAVT